MVTQLVLVLKPMAKVDGLHIDEVWWHDIAMVVDTEWMYFPDCDVSCLWYISATMHSSKR